MLAMLPYGGSELNAAPGNHAVQFKAAVVQPAIGVDIAETCMQKYRSNHKNNPVKCSMKINCYTNR
jgi:hypothetical protein